METTLIPSSAQSSDCGENAEYFFRTNYRKKQHFGYRSEVPMLMAGMEKVMDSSYNNIHNLPGLKYESKPGNVALHSKVPDWLAFHNQVLRFDATDTEQSSQLILGDKHNLYKVLYFLEDDTVQVMSADANSNHDARFRGTILKRHKIPKPGGAYYRLDDFNVNEQLTFYGKTYFIIKCDNYTREFLTKLGILVPENNEEFEKSSIRSATNNRKTSECQQINSAGRARTYPFKQFLAHDGNMLQFGCVWINTVNSRQKLEKLLLRYYLGDDTMEIFLVDGEPSFSQPRSAPNKSKLFIRRTKVPKYRPLEPLPGLKLNEDCSEYGKQEFYVDNDLQIGSTINAWGRQLMIYDCDRFTKEFFYQKYGKEIQSLRLEDIFFDSNLIENTPSKPKNGRQRPRQQVAISPQPYYNNDFIKFMTRDRTGAHSHILRFLARSSVPKYEDRRFIISYHLVDDTISIYEKPIRNLGYQGGKFMDRSYVRKSDNENRNSFVCATDLAIGATVCLNGHWFTITGADEYALSYLEQHSENFPYANRLEILGKIRDNAGENIQELKKLLSSTDGDNVGLINEKTFCDVLRRLYAEDFLSDHEILTLTRSYSVENTHRDAIFKGPRPSSSFSSTFVLQNELRRHQFDDFRGLLKYIQCQDSAKAGVLPKERLTRHCMAYPMPVKKYYIVDALRSLENEAEEVDYNAFVANIDWKNSPAQPVVQETTCGQGRQIDYKNFVKDIV